MKVGLVIYGSLDTLSGGYLYDRRMVEHLRACGDTVEIFSLPWRDYGHHLLDNLTDPLWARLQGADLDVLIEDELNHPSLLTLNRRLRRQGRFPVVGLVHHLRCSERRARWQNALYRQVEARYLRGVDAFIFNSHTTREVVEALAPPRPHVVAWPGGDRLSSPITPARVAARAHEPGPLRLAFVGNVIERKGLHTLLEAMARVAPGSCRLEVAGSLEAEPDYAARVRARCAALGLGARVTFHGPLGDEALRALLQEAHALAVPSSYEGFGIVYMEAAAFGLPSLASSAGAASEVVADGRSGLLVPPEDPRAVAAALARWHQDRDLLAGMGQEALGRFARHPTWAQSAARIRGFLLSLTQAGARFSQS